MNIFFLDANPRIAATYMCDKHVVKMVLETAQLLSTAHHKAGSKYAKDLYRVTHANHPSAVWARATASNYAWLYEHFEALCAEYTRRYFRDHATARLMSKLRRNPCEPGPLTVPPACVTADLVPAVLTWDTVVTAYQAYYARDKRRMLTYTLRDWPAWLAKD